MSLFEFLMVFVSIIVGLGVTEILTGIAMQIRHRDTVKGYWVHSAGVVLIFIALIQNWWELWDRRDNPEWTFLGLVLMLIPPASLYLVAHLIFPEPIEGSNVRQYYYERLRPVWLLAILTAATSSLFPFLTQGESPFIGDNLSTGIMAVGFLALAISSSVRLHSIVVPTFLALLLWDIIRWHPVFTSG
jgi:hypothetical protein